ncbi:GIY-YIG nuclease family protein [Novosphingobium soli]|uniref:GIY-YIG nuclease family protein n=1 Tax=Novosphingobium soli TaxID=574956 RepID=A0ABV6CQB0_9SPHN
MRITSYGLFWKADEIEWAPGAGYKDSFRLLGRVGMNRGKLQVADFRHQQGIYILYDDYGANYVGLSRTGLGKRLRDHTEDKHAGKWDRFSWFGFRPLGGAGSNGVFQLGQTKEEVSENAHATIGDLEALLIKAMGTRNNSVSMRFKDAVEWKQVDWDDIEKYLLRVAPSGDSPMPEVGPRADITD